MPEGESCVDRGFTQRVAQVLALHRFPVKSMVGERVSELDLDERGVVGDRVWSVRTADGKIGSGKTTRRFAAVRGLLSMTVEHVGHRIVITFPNGARFDVEDPRISDRLSYWLDQPVTLAREQDETHFDDGPVSLLGVASVTAVADAQDQEVDAVRFRANILIDSGGRFEEDSWLGRKVRIGTAVIRVTAVLPRCVMVDMSAADLASQHGNLWAVGRLNAGHLGVVADVVQPGWLGLGDEVLLE